jgi:hypothetical protein
MTMPAETAVTGTATPNLNKALAAVQAEFPSVAKGETAEVTGTTKDGRPVRYSYKYADLAACSEAVLPLLGKNGLAFCSRPGLVDGTFCLVYELLHESGESKGGVFPLPSGGKPQDLGGLLTYYRRYALCAVTGLAPAGDDDDAQSSNTAHRFDTRSAGAAFDEAQPAPPRRQQAANGHASRPEPQDRPGVSATELDPDAQPYADEAHEARTVAALSEIHVRAREAHKLAAFVTNPATQGKGGLGQYLNWRKAALEKSDRAFAAMQAAAAEAEVGPHELAAFVLAQAKVSIEDATAEQMDAITALLRQPAGADA